MVPQLRGRLSSYTPRKRRLPSMPRKCQLSKRHELSSRLVRLYSLCIPTSSILFHFLDRVLDPLDPFPVLNSLKFKHMNEPIPKAQ